MVPCTCDGMVAGDGPAGTCAVMPAARTDSHVPLRVGVAAMISVIRSSRIRFWAGAGTAGQKDCSVRAHGRAGKTGRSDSTLKLVRQHGVSSSVQADTHTSGIFGVVRKRHGHSTRPGAQGSRTRHPDSILLLQGLHRAYAHTGLLHRSLCAQILAAPGELAATQRCLAGSAPDHTEPDAVLPGVQEVLLPCAALLLCPEHRRTAAPERVTNVMDVAVNVAADTRTPWIPSWIPWPAPCPDGSQYVWLRSRPCPALLHTLPGSCATHLARSPELRHRQQAAALP